MIELLSLSSSSICSVDVVVCVEGVKEGTEETGLKELLVMTVDDVTVLILTACGLLLRKLWAQGDKEWRDVEVVEFLDHLVVLNCIEGGAEVNKEDLK